MDHYPEAPCYDIDQLSEFDVSGDRILGILHSLNVHKACGPDGLSGRILKECAVEFSVPLTKLCRLSLRQGIFPRTWKRAHVTPVFKKGDRKDERNYRPVSLLSICSKILERVVCDQIIHYVSPVFSSPARISGGTFL